MKKSAYFVIALLAAAVLVLSSCPLPQGLVPQAVGPQAAGPQVAEVNGIEMSVTILAASAQGSGARTLIDDGGVTTVYVTAVNSSGQVVGSGGLAKDSEQRVWRGVLNVSETGLIDFIAVAKNSVGSPLWTGKHGTTVTGSGGSVTIPMSPMTGLVGEWLFSGNANDTSGNGHNGTATGVIPKNDRFRTADHAYQINGGGQYIDCGNPTDNSLDVGTDATISMWCKFYSPVANGQAFISKSDTSGTYWYLAYNSNALYWLYRGATTGDLVSTAWSPLTLRWYHIVVVKSGLDYSFYINGQAWGTQSATVEVPYPIAGDLMIGNFAGSHINGLLDDVRMYNRALSADEILSLYLDGGWPNMTPSTGGPVGEWLFSGNANDTSGNGHNGTVNGASLTTDRFDVADHAYQINGTDQYIYCSNPSDYSLDVEADATISLWCKFDSPVNNGDVFISKSDGSGTYWYLSYNSNALYWLYRGATTGDLFSTAWSPTTGLWYHIVVVKSGLDYSFYINGQAWGTQSATVEIPYPIAADLMIGRFGGSHINGALDDVRIYNRALSADEVSTIYHEGGY